MVKHNTMLKSQPTIYVKAMAIEIAQGALISGCEILADITLASDDCWEMMV